VSLATLSFSNPQLTFYPGISEELWSFSGCMGDSAAKKSTVLKFLFFLGWFCLGKGDSRYPFLLGGDPKLMQICAEFEGFPMDFAVGNSGTVTRLDLANDPSN